MCDTFVALGNSTHDGSVIFAKNSDRDPNEAHEVVIIPAATHLPGEKVKCTYIEIPQVEKTNRILLAKPFWIWGAEMGSNEFGVTIGNEAVFTRIPYEKEPGLIGMDFLRLALERSSSAEEALTVITGLLEEYGQSGNCGFSHPFYYHNSFLICDRHTGWVLETAGRQWVAEKITDVRSISNALTIEDHWDLASKDLVNIAIKKNWCRNREEFNFRKCYSEPIYTFFGDGKKRQQITQSLLLENRGKIDVSLMMKILRNHSNTDQKANRLDQKILGSDVCMHAGWGPARGSQSVGSQISKLSTAGDCHWVTGTSAPCVSIFKPLWLENEMPFVGNPPTGEFDPSSLFWRHEKLHRAILEDYGERSEIYHQYRDRLEKEFLEKADQMTIQANSDKLEFSQKCFSDS